MRVKVRERCRIETRARLDVVEIGCNHPFLLFANCGSVAHWDRTQTKNKKSDFFTGWVPRLFTLTGSGDE